MPPYIETALALFLANPFGYLLAAVYVTLALAGVDALRRAGWYVFGVSAVFDFDMPALEWGTVRRALVGGVGVAVVAWLVMG